MAFRALFSERVAKGQTVRENVTSGGFVDVTFNGQHHSSNLGAASFDRALAGATASTVTGIRLQGSSADTLVLGSQQGSSGLTVQAGGATVVTQDVTASGPLTIQAANITVSGSLNDSNVTLAASGWVTVDAAAHIDISRRLPVAASRWLQALSSTAASCMPTGRAVAESRCRRAIS
jgi:hypothetical protein